MRFLATGYFELKQNYSLTPWAISQNRKAASASNVDVTRGGFGLV